MIIWWTNVRDAMLPALAESTGHVLWRARKRVGENLATVLPPDVDPHAFSMLKVLDGDAARSQQELARAVGVSRTTAGKVAATLVAQGYVERVRNPADQRSYLLTRTPAGDEAVHEWRAHLDVLRRHMTAALSPAEHDELIALLARALAPALPSEVPEHLCRSIGFLVTRLHEQLHRDFADTLEPLGLDPAHVGALLALSTVDPPTQAGLAGLLAVSGARTVQLVDELEQRGVVERRRAPADRRTHELHLVPDALPRVRRALEASRDVAAEHLAALDADEQERLRVLLLRFAVPDA